MRLVTYLREQRERVGVVLEDQVVDLAALAHHAGSPSPSFESMTAFLQGGGKAQEDAGRLLAKFPAPELAQLPLTAPLSAVTLQASVPRPGKIIALGLNYRDHAAEQGIEVPRWPLIFAKFSSSVTGPYDPIILPSEDAEVDYEVELGVVIGRRGRRIGEDQALDYVAGYLVVDDVSARKWQFADQQWTRGKSCDTFAPLGPWLTTRDEVADPHDLTLETRVNGEIRQQSNTSNMIFRIPAAIAFISASITLEPGDIIATGTPPGVGMFRKPPTFLRPGDLVETEVEGLGCLRNTVQAP